MLKKKSERTVTSLDTNFEKKLLLFGSRKVGGSFQFLVAPCGMFPDSSAGKESACNAGDPSSIPG